MVTRNYEKVGGWGKNGGVGMMDETDKEIKSTRIMMSTG